MNANGYSRYPAPGPSRRTVRLLIWLTVVLLLCNLAHQAGVG